MTKKPNAPLPWKMCELDYRIIEDFSELVVADVRTHPALEDSAYLCHAANAYPRLVEALAELAEILDGNPEMETPLDRAGNKAIALLLSLGEFERN